MLPTALIHIEHLPLIRVRFTAASLRQVPYFYVPSLGRQGPDETPPADTGFLLELYPLLSPMVREEKEVIVTKGDRGGDLIFLTKGQACSSLFALEPTLFTARATSFSPAALSPATVLSPASLFHHRAFLSMPTSA